MLLAEAWTGAPLDADWSPDGTAVAIAMDMGVRVLGAGDLGVRCATDAGRNWVGWLGNGAVVTSLNNRVRAVDRASGEVVAERFLEPAWAPDPTTSLTPDWPVGDVSPDGRIIAVGTPQRVYVLRVVGELR